MLLPKKEDWPFSGPGPACGPKAEWVKVAEGLEASLLLPLAQSPIPLRAASCGGHNSGQSKQLECDRQKACLVLFKKVRILPELEATQNISNYG